MKETGFYIGGVTSAVEITDELSTLSDEDKDRIWKELTPGEKAAYKYPMNFTKIIADTIPRYRDHYDGSLFAAYQAVKKITETGTIPLGRDYYDGFRRVKLFRAVATHALIRDNEDADGAAESSDKPEQAALDLE